MIAYQTDREEGRDYKRSAADCDKIAFHAVGKNRAESMYRTSSRQREFLEGWMENWNEPAPGTVSSGPDDETGCEERHAQR